jgi:hypothetical protein
MKKAPNIAAKKCRSSAAEPETLGLGTTKLFLLLGHLRFHLPRRSRHILVQSVPGMFTELKL